MQQQANHWVNPCSTKAGWFGRSLAPTASERDTFGITFTSPVENTGQPAISLAKVEANRTMSDLDLYGRVDASPLDILFVEIDLFDARFLNHMRFSQASLWFVFTKSSSAFGTTLRNRPASAGTIDTIASTISFGSR
jgi:hypothetical protein